MNPKEQGNREERKQAKQLSIWMFNDKDMLKRHPSSGMDKTVYTGDIIPMKQLSEFGWKKFKFMIEVKNGYLKDIPTFWSHNKIEKWYIKAKKEASKDQTILLLICQFKNKPALIFIDQFLKSIPFNNCILVNNGNPNSYEYLYCYKLQTLLDMDFNFIFMDINYNSEE